MSSQPNPKYIAMIDQWLVSLSDLFDFPNLALDQEGTCGLAVEDGPTILLYLTGDRLALATYLLDKSEEIYNLDMFEQFLSWNYRNTSLNGLVIGYCPTASHLTLSASFELSALDSTALYNALQNFNNKALEINEYILEMIQARGSGTNNLAEIAQHHLRP